MSKRIEIKAGDKYGRLTIIKEVEPHIETSGRLRRKMLCQCDCGNTTIVLLGNIKRKNAQTTSCGCYHSKVISDLKTIHGLDGTPLRYVWGSMKQRCCNPNSKAYKSYGGRGISVCEEWRNDFMTFYNWAIENGWQKGLQIDRRDNDGNYEPGNCRFVTNSINMRNRSCVVLDEDTAKRIRELREKTGWGKVKIARALNLRVTAVDGILYQNTWKPNETEQIEVI